MGYRWRHVDAVVDAAFAPLQWLIEDSELSLPLFVLAALLVMVAQVLLMDVVAFALVGTLLYDLLLGWR